MDSPSKIFTQEAGPSDMGLVNAISTSWEDVMSPDIK